MLTIVWLFVWALAGAPRVDRWWLVTLIIAAVCSWAKVEVKR